MMYSLIRLFARYGKQAIAALTIIFVASLLWLQYKNNITLIKQATIIESLTVQLEERKVLIESIKDGVAEANEISKRYLAIENKERERRDEKLDEIQKILKANQCANTRHPQSVGDRLRN